MCSSSSGPHCQFITGRRDSSPSVTGTNNKGQNIVQITRSSRNDFWSTTSGVASLDFLDELNSLLRHMLHSTQNDGIERVEFGPTTQSSMQDSNSNDGQCRLHESGFVATMKENNPYWEANLDQERVIQVDVYDGHPAGGMFLSLSNRTGPIIQKLDEIYDLEEAPGHTWIKLLPDECEMIFVDTSGDRKVRRRVCRYHVERHFKDEVGIIRLGVEGFEQLRLGRVDVWVSRTNRFNSKRGENAGKEMEGGDGRKKNMQPELVIYDMPHTVKRLSTAEELQEFLGDIETELWSLFRATMDDEDEKNDDNE